MAVGNPISLTDNVASRIVSQIATASQTDFTISGGYRLNAISVYRNGVRLVSGRDYSAADGSTVVLLSPATASDALEFHVFDDFRVADAIVSNASHQNIEGNLTVTGILTASNLIGSNLELQSLTVTNDVSIGGTLTYEDVKNIDSVGVITARTDVHVGAGLSVVGVSTFHGNAIFNGNIDLGNASGDTITATGRFDSDLIPSADDQKDLGSSTLEWRDLYLDGTANIDTLSVSGKVGIGITNPTAKLEVSGGDLYVNSLDGSEVDIKLGIHATHSNFGVIKNVRDSNSQNHLSFNIHHSTGLYEALQIHYDEGLYVKGYGDYDTTAYTGNVSHVLFGDKSDDFADIVVESESASSALGAFVFKTRGSSGIMPQERLRITSAGRIGIGTDNPQGILHVSDGANGLEFNPNSENAVVSYNRVTSAYAPVGLQGSTVSLRIGGVGTALKVDSAGKIGIGTDNPSAKLEVSGDARVTGILTVGTSSVTINGNTGKVTGVSDTQLAAISSSVSDTAVDVFVYDTSKDSDGGAWRKRTTHTSWYNETLGTATRGTRREFPAVAVIVAETTKVTIYDGDDPDLPMWMVFSANAAALYTTPNAVSVLNGTILVALPTYGLVRYDFVGDTIGRWRANASYDGYKSPDRSIGGRDTAIASFIDGSPFNNAFLVNDNINDVTVTVLPNAPIDSATGLPIPTIAVATAGGVSVIKDDGNVYDLNIVNRPYSSVDFTSDNLIFAVENPSGVDYDLMRYFKIPSADRDNSNAPNTYGPSSLPALFPTNTKGNIFDSFAYGSPVGLSIIDHANGTAPTTSGMIAYTTSDYNTGWMHGDIKSAFLSDTYTGADFGPEIVTGGNFSDASQWTLGTGWSINGSGQAVHASGAAGYIQQTGSFTQGKYYQLTADLVSGNAGNFGIINHNTVGTEQPHNKSTVADVYCVGSGKIVAMWKQSSTNLTAINLYANSALTVDNVSIKEISRFYYDRSVNNKPLAVFGTITKSAVATGAELVAYSGFSASNHLLQPNNSDLQFGTGDLYMIFWHKKTNNSANEVLFQAADTTTGGNGASLSMQHLSGNYYAYTTGGAGGPGGTNDFLTGAFVADGNWHCVAVVRSNGTLTIYVDGRNVGSGVRNYNVNNTGDLYIGSYSTAGTATAQTSTMALIRIGGSAPSPEQVKKIYDDEKCLFHENAKATLYGSSDAVTALAFDEATNLLHVGTSAGRSDFSGLRRINNTTTAVTTAISAHDGSIAQQ